MPATVTTSTTAPRAPSARPAIPARVFKGLKMAGHMGHEQVTTLNLEVVRPTSSATCCWSRARYRAQRRRRHRPQRSEGQVTEMASITVRNSAGDDTGTLDLDNTVFGVQPNVPLMHQVVTAQLAARRSGTQSTKTHAEVRGGGDKPFKQKGTGNARPARPVAAHERWRCRPSARSRASTTRRPPRR